VKEHPPTLRTPYARVQYLGAAHAGTRHFWHQRLTSVALLPLTIAFVVIVVSLLGRNHAAAKEVLGSPLIAVVMLLFVVTTVYHMWLGMQVVVEDYVTDELWKLVTLMANTFFSFVVALACCYAILKLSFGV
jgi:succinate dehydrogenase / fumarate reductase membrane anchor subunit